jgi:hypothetical protein
LIADTYISTIGRYRSTSEVGELLDNLRPLRRHSFSCVRVAKQIKGELVTEGGMFGAAVEAEPSPPLGDLIQFGRTDLPGRRHHLARRASDVIETCWGETLFGKYLLRGVEQQ